MKKETKEKIKNNLKVIGTIFFLLVMSGYWWNFQVRRTTYPSHDFSETITADSTLSKCTRSEPYPKPAEFDRVLSLILQRQQQANHPYSKKFQEMRNCLDIGYTNLSDTNGAEGVFYFDEQVSSPNRLVIEVDESYSFTDDITTAYLLSHELTHARQYVETITQEKTWGCIDSEVEAFYEQLVFGSLLNEEEAQSVVSRLERGSQNTQLRQYEQLLDLSWNSIQTCGQNNPTCWKKDVTLQIRKMIVSNPFYQQQCQTEL